MESNEKAACLDAKLEEATEGQQTEMFHFSLIQQKRTFLDIRKRLIKLLGLIEKESKGEADISLWLIGFLYELNSSDLLCEGKLNRVIVKINGLFANNNYKTMSHKEIKNQIFECRGILDFLIKEIDDKLN